MVPLPLVQQPGQLVPLPSLTLLPLTGVLREITFPTLHWKVIGRDI
jgi:hypothetical protein